MDILNPPVSTLIKLGSLMVHIEEYISTQSHQFDLAAIQSLIADDEIKEWRAGADELGLLPVKR